MLQLTHTAVPVVANVALASLVLAVMSSAMLASGWRRRMVRGDGRTEVARRPIAWLAAAVLIAAKATYESDMLLPRMSLTFSHDGVRLSGTLYLPRSRGPHPAVVLVHGSGPESRHEYAYFARRLARAGIAALAYDKRGVGASTGQLYETDYAGYASDVVAALTALRGNPRVVSSALGLVGFSEAEWTIPLAMLGHPEVALVAIVGPSGLSPAQQVKSEMALRLRARGHADAVVREAMALSDGVFAYQRTGQGRDSVQRRLDAVRQYDWFRDAGKIPAQLHPAEAYAWWRSVMDVDPLPMWERIGAPLLLIKGGRDAQSGAEHSLRAIAEARRRGGFEAPTIFLVAEGDHMMLTWPLGQRVPPPLFARDYPDALIRWVDSVFMMRRTTASPAAMVDPAARMSATRRGLQ